MGHEQFPAWARSVEQVLAHHRVDLDSGLSSAEVEDRRAAHGFNELDKPPSTPVWKLILEQFDDTLVKILLAAAGISFFLAWVNGEVEESGLRALVEPAVILLILALNAAVGVWQESNAESALEALKEMSADSAKVHRDGKVTEVPARELVPGDIVELHAGDRVPADVRVVLCRTAALRSEQATLTGESQAVSKVSTPVRGGDAVELQAKENMLFAGTAVVSGACVAVVNDIGMATEMGKIQAQIQEASEEDSDTPLKRKLDEFGEALAKIILYVCVAVWAINYHHFLSWKPLEGWGRVPDLSTLQFSAAKCTFYFKVAVALAVAAIPEGLPAVITTCLALGTRKMAKRNAIVRRLPSVETLGCTTIICSDKTGTLTTNQMAAASLVVPGKGGALRTLAVSGTTYDPDDGGVEGTPALDAPLLAVAEVCALCNDASLDFKHGHFRAVGQSTEAALLVLAEKLGLPGAADTQAVRSARAADPAAAPTGACAAYVARLPKLATLEFDRDRKSMSVLCALSGSRAAAPPPSPARRSARLAAVEDSAGGGNGALAGRTAGVLLVKGAAECVLARCSSVLLPSGEVAPLGDALRRQVASTVDEMASRALRVLAFARRTELGPLAGYDGGERHPARALLADPSRYAQLESGLTFLGLAALRDPPRPEVPTAIGDCQRAGVRVIMITGDNRLTGEAICAQVGIFPPGADASSRSLTGSEFAALPEGRQLDFLLQEGGLCFSRAEPRHKQAIVRLLRSRGEVVAMTGDGVNDAPALKMADIGVAMGETGTEVAKEAADMVLADDNFATVVAAVEEGRSIYDNMKAFIRYMISSNIGEVASIFLAAALGLPEGLLPVQLLWVNLVTDGPPATALGFNRPDPDIMSKPPRRADDHFITPWILFRWMVVGLYVGFATVGAFVTWYTADSFLWGLIDLSADGHTPVTFGQLRGWESCPSWAGFQPSAYTAGDRTLSFSDNPCDYFGPGKIKASTLSLSVLVAIEMFNAANALSEDNSLLKVPVWTNPYLLLAMATSFGLHCLILYVPPLADTFSIVPLSGAEWALVLAYALPVVLIDEALKWVGRTWVHPRTPPAAEPAPAGRRRGGRAKAKAA